MIKIIILRHDQINACFPDKPGYIKQIDSLLFYPVDPVIRQL